MIHESDSVPSSKQNDTNGVGKESLKNGLFHARLLSLRRRQITSLVLTRTFWTDGFKTPVL